MNGLVYNIMWEWLPITCLSNYGWVCCMILFHLVESTVKRAVVSSYHWLCHVPQNKMATQSISIWKLIHWHCCCHSKKKCLCFHYWKLPSHYSNSNSNSAGLISDDFKCPYWEESSSSYYHNQNAGKINIREACLEKILQSSIREAPSN